MTADEESEHNWVSAGNPAALLRMLEGRASDRKLRLFACAVCRDLWPLLPDHPDLHEGLAVAERWADAPTDDGSLERAHARLKALRDKMDAATVLRDAVAGTRFTALVSAALTSNADAAAAARYLAARAGAWVRVLSSAKLVTFLRDVFANPFRQPSLSAAALAWQGGALAQLAQAAYDERQLPAGTLDPARLAVLADALDDAGCADESITAHLRAPGPHVRGCWVVDLILGKS